MNYDERIRDYHDIRCFASRNNRECLGKFGYFAEDISELSNVDNCIFGRCYFKDGSEYPFYKDMYDKNGTEDECNAYPIFVPIDAVDITQSNSDLITLMEEKNADILCHKIYRILQPLTFIKYDNQMKHRSANLILRGIKETLQAYFIERTKEE